MFGCRSRVRSHCKLGVPAASHSRSQGQMLSVTSMVTSAPRTRADHRSRGAADDPLRSEKTPGGRVTIGQAKGPRGPSITSCAHDVGPVECCIALQLYSSTAALQYTPSTSPTSGVVHVVAVCASGRAVDFVCALLDVSPRDRRLCVLPGPGRANERKRVPSIQLTFSQVPL